MKDRSEEIRLRYLYRRVILAGKARVSLETARALVGPDSAYHLYRLVGSNRIILPGPKRKGKGHHPLRDEKHTQ